MGMAEALPLSDASVDVTASIASFHHWADRANWIREIARVRRVDGQLVLADIVVPEGLSWFVHHLTAIVKIGRGRCLLRLGLETEAEHRRMTRFLVITVGKKRAT
jgi:ubiquinone/menaquinone biosynthesis C-methylase UbiE